jgi:pterin-4a-carbinolamine dehydratase
VRSPRHTARSACQGRRRCPSRRRPCFPRRLPPGQRDGNRTLRREFSFPDFRDAFGLVARVALLAESEGHHPEIELGWGRAAFSLTTHAAGGLTRNDFIMAARIDELARG